MAKARKTPGSIKVPASTVAELNSGTRSTANLAECLTVDFAELMSVACPDVPPEAVARLTAGNPAITERMRIAGEILLEHVGLDNFDHLLDSASDTVRAWGAYVIGLAPGLSMPDRLERIRALADDLHFGVREWAWLAVRPHLAADIRAAIGLLEPWAHARSPFLRRFAVEATRPRGVWCAHIAELKENPRLGLPLLRPLRADLEKYVQDSVSNWLNDAAKSKPDWVRGLIDDWATDCDNRHTLRICRRAVRSIRNDESSFP